MPPVTAGARRLPGRHDALWKGSSPARGSAGEGRNAPRRGGSPWGTSRGPRRPARPRRGANRRRLPPPADHGGSCGPLAQHRPGLRATKAGAPLGGGGTGTATPGGGGKNPAGTRAGGRQVPGRRASLLPSLPGRVPAAGHYHDG